VPGEGSEGERPARVKRIASRATHAEEKKYMAKAKWMNSDQLILLLLYT
jgi:hypothetical protein